MGTIQFETPEGKELIFPHPSTSPNITSCPLLIIALTVAVKVMGEVMIVLFFGNVRNTHCNAVVQAEVAIAYFAPTNSANYSSNFLVSGPVTTQPDFMTLATASISS